MLILSPLRRSLSLFVVSASVAPAFCRFGLSPGNGAIAVCIEMFEHLRSPAMRRVPELSQAYRPVLVSVRTLHDAFNHPVCPCFCAFRDGGANFVFGQRSVAVRVAGAKPRFAVCIDLGLLNYAVRVQIECLKHPVQSDFVMSLVVATVAAASRYSDGRAADYQNDCSRDHYAGGHARLHFFDMPIPRWAAEFPSKKNHLTNSRHGAARHFARMGFPDFAPILAS